MWQVLVLLVVLLAPGARAADEPVVEVSREGIRPQRIEVHVGELVIWRSGKGQILRLELDPHPTAHEVVIRTTEIRAFFRKPGLHSYSIVVQGDGPREFRGLVMVREGQGPTEPTPLCAGAAFERICVEP